MAPAADNSEIAASQRDDAARLLCTRIRAGDEAAFVTLYEAWFDRLLSFAISCTRRDEAFALDIVQETFLRVIRSLPPLTTAAALESWLMTTARRVAIDTMRSEHARRSREGLRLNKPTQETREQGELDSIEALTSAINALEAQEREALLIRVASGLSMAQAAASMGITQGATHGRVRRSLEKLRSAFARVMP